MSNWHKAHEHFTGIIIICCKNNRCNTESKHHVMADKESQDGDPPINTAERHSSNFSTGPSQGNDSLRLKFRSITRPGQDDDKFKSYKMGLDDDEYVNEDDIEENTRELSNMDDDDDEKEKVDEVALTPCDEGKGSEVGGSEASWNSAEAREAAIRDGFIAFLIGYIQSQFFAKLMGWVNVSWVWFKKKIGRGNEEGENAGIDADDLVQEAIEAADPGITNMAGGGIGGPAPTPPNGAPGVLPGPPPGVAEMAAAASQSAASAGAAGASAGAAAGGAAAGAGSAAAGMVSALASAGVAGQVGAAVGVAAVAAAVSSGLAVNTNTTQPTVRPAPFIDNFEPPACSADSVLKQGYLELQIAGLAPSVLPGNKQILELLFR
jgi:hypothetical protein